MEDTEACRVHRVVLRFLRFLLGSLLLLLFILLVVVDGLMLELVGHRLRRRREASPKILLHHERSDGHTISSTPLAVFDIYADGDLRVAHRCESHERGVVLSVRVLCRSRLSADLKSRDVGPRTRTFENGTAHTLPDIVVVERADIRGLERGERVGHLSVLNGMYDMRNLVLSPVGDGGPEVCDLQRSGQHLALSDRDRDDRERVPVAFVCVVVELCVRDESPTLTW